MTISARIGVANSARYLKKNKRMVGHLLTPGKFGPDALLEGMAPAFADPSAKIETLHVFTFNQVAATVEWQERMLNSTRRGLMPTVCRQADAPAPTRAPARPAAALVAGLHATAPSACTGEGVARELDAVARSSGSDHGTHGEDRVPRAPPREATCRPPAVGPVRRNA